MPAMGREMVSGKKLECAFMADSLRIRRDAPRHGTSHLGRVNRCFGTFFGKIEPEQEMQAHPLDPPTLGAPTCRFANQTQEANMQFHIQNMTCFGCARSVTAAIQSVDKAAVVKADPENRKVNVETSAARAKIEAVLAETGYPVREDA